MNSFDAKFFNKSLWKPKTNIKAVKPITPHFAKPATNGISMLNSKSIPKGASLTMQKQWKSFSFPTKQAMRMKYPDRDGDGVPNKWDCQPNNFWKQDIYVKPSKEELQQMSFPKLSRVVDFQTKHIPPTDRHIVRKHLQELSQLKYDKDIPYLSKKEEMENLENLYKKQPLTNAELILLQKSMEDTPDDNYQEKEFNKALIDRMPHHIDEKTGETVFHPTVEELDEKEWKEKVNTLEKY
jgi:hypothetical protein